MFESSANVEATFKSKDTEESIDILFYRPVGYRLALISEKLKITPNTITVISIFWGILAGHLFYYQDLYINVIGMLSLIFANALDSADGQLARITNTRTKLGRFLDGLAGNLWFVSIYIHLCLRIISEGGSAWIFGFVLVVGVFHSFQSAMADYYRNAYLYFVEGKSKGEVDTSSGLKKEFKAASWKNDFVNKLFLRLYLNYTNQQELLSSNLQRLYSAVDVEFGDKIPKWFKEKFRALNKPLMKYCNILTTNTRMMVLFISIFLDYVLLYFLFEVTVLNVLLAYLVYRQEKISKKLYSDVKSV